MKAAAIPLAIVILGAALTFYPAGGQPGGGGTEATARSVVKDEWGFGEWVPAALDGDSRRAALVREAAIVTADVIEADAKFPAPRFSDTAQVASLWADTLDFATRAQGAVPESFGQQFEATANAANGITPNGEGADLTPELRARVVQFFRALSQAV